MPLTGQAARSLRALAHRLEPVVQIGKGGLTERVQQAVSRALLDHELIKVKLPPDAPTDRKLLAARLASRTGSEAVQLIGRTLVLYKPHPKKPTIAVPKGYTPPSPAAHGKDEDE
jgi:RNA-binding protein